MASLDETSILELGTSPIPGGSPCGIDAAEDELYIAVMAEMPKLDRIDAEEPDWRTLERNATTVLNTKSKDIEIAAAFGHALFKRYSYAGLAGALGLLDGLVRQFWDDSFPKRPRRRKARIEALATRFVDGQWFRDNPPKPGDFDALDMCVSRGEALKEALTERMPDEPPDFRKFMDGLKGLAGKRPKVAAPPPLAASASTAPASEGAPTPAPAGDAPVVGAIDSASGAEIAVLKAADFLRKKDPTDPVAYAALRAVKWAGIDLPPTSGPGIPSPASFATDWMKEQLGKQAWGPLLERAEEMFRNGYPLWLDLQRLVGVSMEGLGPTYEEARTQVVAHTSALVARLGEGVFSIKFEDGTPACSGETKLWLDSIATSQSSAGGSGGASMGGANGELTEALEKARKLTSSGKIREAILKLQAGQFVCSQRRDRFLWKFRIAELCLDSQRITLAAPLLEELFAETERFQIAEWEPSLAVQVAQALYRCRKAASQVEKPPSPEALAGVRDSFAWLCQLDPVAALAVEPAAK